VSGAGQSFPYRAVEATQRVLWRAFGRIRRSDNLWSLIETTGIVVFVGPNGSGKSLAAVHGELSTLAGRRWECAQLAHHHNAAARRHWSSCDRCERHPQGRVGLCPEALVLVDRYGVGDRLVYSTVPLLDGDAHPHPRYRPLVDYRQLVGVEHADVLFDEVAGVSDAADSASMPVQVTNWLHQLRKRDVRLRVTTPAYSRCSKPIRQVAQVIVDARSFCTEPAQAGRLWRSRRAMLFSAYDAFEFEDYTSSTGKRVKARAAAAFWRPGSLAERSYDTLGAVLALGHVTDGGMCAVCGGSRSRPRCACDHSVDDIPAEQLLVVEKVSGAGARTRTGRVMTDAEAAGEVTVGEGETLLPPLGLPAETSPAPLAQ
jgi:hypothetical protein